MGVLYNSIPSSSVTVSGSQTVMPVGNSGRTLFCKSLVQNPAVANDWTTLHTVTAGKTFYLYAYQVAGNGVGIVRFGTNASGNAYTDGTVYTDSIVTFVGDNINSVGLSIPISYAAGVAINAAAASAIGYTVTIWGWEE